MKFVHSVMRLLLSLGILTFVPSLAAAQAAPGSRILVMPFSTKVGPSAPGGAGTALWLGEASSILLGEGLSSLGLGALAREERIAAFERLQLPMSAALTRATMIRVGELVGATEIVFGDVTLDRTLQVRARTISLQNGQERPAVTESDALAEMFVLFARVAQRVSSGTGRVQSARSAVVTPLPLETFESYMKGLVAPSPPAQQRFIEAALAQAPTDARILLAAWSVYHTQGLHDKALAAANGVDAMSSFGQRARFAVALSLIELRRFDGAFQELSALHGREPSAAVSNALGVVQLRRAAPGGTPPAATYFARATKEAPDNTDYLFNLGYTHALRANTAEALTWLREVVRFDAADAEAHLVMSSVLASTGRAAEAQRERELARLLGAEVPAATGVPAGLERITDSLDMSVVPTLSAAIANPAQRDQQETAAFHLGRAREHLLASRDREATNELRRAIYLAPYEDEPHLLLGRVYQRGGRLTEAMDEFRVAIWCRDTAVARLALAGALLESGERDAARAEAERALVLAPASPEARDLIQRLAK